MRAGGGGDELFWHWGRAFGASFCSCPSGGEQGGSLTIGGGGDPEALLELVHKLKTVGVAAFPGDFLDGRVTCCQLVADNCKPFGFDGLADGGAEKLAESEVQ